MHLFCERILCWLYYLIKLKYLVKMRYRTINMYFKQRQRKSIRVTPHVTVWLLSSGLQVKRL